jgi:hypothetical protein
LRTRNIFFKKKKKNSVLMKTVAFKKRKGPNTAPAAGASDAMALQQCWTSNCVDLLKKAGAAMGGGQGGDNPQVVCLVDSAFSHHPIVSHLTYFKVREANLDNASFILPSKKTAFLVLEAGTQEAGPNLTRQDLEILAAVQAKSFFVSAKKNFSLCAASYGQCVCLVIANMDLFKLLSLESISTPSATVIYCGNVDHAVRHIWYRASLPELSQRIATHQETVTDIFAQPLLHQRIARSISAMPSNRLLTGTDLLDLLSGRVSQDVCVEHFGWSTATAAAVLRAMEESTDRIKET